MALPITITYNSFVIGTSSATIREGSYSESHSYRRYSMNVDFVITGTDDATFVANLQAAESALSEENKAFTVMFGSETHVSLDPVTTYTGLNITTSLNKRGDQVDTNRSRLYSFSINADYPADATGKNYQDDHSYNITFDASNRMSIAISGSFTAGNSATAGSNYQLYIDSWVDAVFSNLDTIFSASTISESDFELISERTDFKDENNHEVTYSRTYQQRLYPDSAAGDNTSIKNASVSYVRNYNNRSGAKGTGPVRVSVSYSCNVDTQQTTYTGLKALYVDTIKPWLLAQAKSTFGGRLSAIEQGSETLDVTGNSIRSSMTVLISGGTSNKVKEDVTYTINYTSRKTYVDLWDGRDYSYNIYSPGEDITATVRTNIVVISKSGAGLKPAGEPPTPRKGIKGIWDENSTTEGYGSEFLGQDPDGKGTAVTLFSKDFTQQFKWVKSGQVVQPNLGGPSRRTVLRSGPAKQFTGKKLE